MDKGSGRGRLDRLGARPAAARTESGRDGERGALALRPPAPSLVDTLGAEALDWLAALAARLVLPAALFGAIFVPSPNPGTPERSEVPGHPGLSYALDHDTGTLRLSLDNDADPSDALVARLGADGVYRDVETNAAIARAIGSSAVLIDLDRAPAIAESARPTPTSPSSARRRRMISPVVASCSTSFTSNTCATSSIRSGDRSLRPSSPSRFRPTQSQVGCITTIAEKPLARWSMQKAIMRR